MTAAKTIILSLLLTGFASAEPVKEHHEAAVLFKEKCAQCHGQKAEGNAKLKTPTLASQSSIYLGEQLKKFKEGVRGRDSKSDAVAHLMAQQVKNLSQKQIDQLTAYLSSLKAPAIKQENEQAAQRGEVLYHKKANCTSCHGLYAEGNDTMKAPKLNILSAAYIEASLKKFARGQRAGVKVKDHMGDLMVKVINDYSLTGKDFKDLSHYISGLKPKNLKE